MALSVKMLASTDKKDSSQALDRSEGTTASISMSDIALAIAQM